MTVERDQRATSNLAALALLVAFCALQPRVAIAAPAPQGSRAANADTIVKLAGRPVHPGVATLVEEASIGVVDGAEEYMLGEVSDLAVGLDGSLYVFDRKVPTIRQYDAKGKFVRNVGRAGSGPGEYRAASGLAIARDGRLLLWDTGNWRVNVYSPTGQILPQWSTAPASSGSSAMYSRALLVDSAGVVYCRTTLWNRENPAERATAWIRVDAAKGAVRDTIRAPSMPVEQPKVSSKSPDGRSSTSAAIPFSPRVFQVLSPLGYFVTGYSNRYAFELHPPGSPVVSVRRDMVAERVTSAERNAERQRVEEAMLRNNPSWSWNGPAIPETKPLYSDLMVGLDGRIWVALVSETSTRIGSTSNSVRMGGGQAPSGPPPESPSRATKKVDLRPALYDVFEPTGTYLGQVEVPPRVSTVLRRGDLVWAVAFGEDDVASVKRYRIAWK